MCPLVIGVGYHGFAYMYVRKTTCRCVSVTMTTDMCLQLLRYILSRNSILLPAYFAHDEVTVQQHVSSTVYWRCHCMLMQICRHYPDKNTSAHWVRDDYQTNLCYISWYHIHSYSCTVLLLQILQEIIGSLQEQMRAAADLVSGIGRVSVAMGPTFSRHCMH